MIKEIDIKELKDYLLTKIMSKKEWSKEEIADLINEAFILLSK